jgi:hypothetical protein
MLRVGPALALVQYFYFIFLRKYAKERIPLSGTIHDWKNELLLESVFCA